MSLFSDIQFLTEKMHRLSTGLNFEEFIIGHSRRQFLSKHAAHSRDLSGAACVFFRKVDDALRIAIYFDRAIISALERNDPRNGLSENNISAFLMFIEEINHAVHGAVQFTEGERDIRREAFARNLELLAKIDAYLFLKYFVARFNRSRQLEMMDRLWLRTHVFESAVFDYEQKIMENRYRETIVLGEKFTRFLDGIPVAERNGELLRLRKMRYAQKKNYIRLLPN